jgi:hypothetical protein
MSELHSKPGISAWHSVSLLRFMWAASVVRWKVAATTGGLAISKTVEMRGGERPD